MKRGKLELTWVGKEDRPRLEPRVLVEDPQKSYGDPTSENMLIFGDNLLALKALEQDFAGKIKCIAVDPPYNTGSAFEHYDDGLEHSIWLSMMRDRLEMLRLLLRDDGTIWITIDDNEAHYLKVVCDEIFGRMNFLSNVVWQKRTSPDNRLRLGDAHDTVLVYCKDKLAGKTTLNQLSISDGRAKDFKNPDNDPRGPWASTDFTGMTGHATPNQFYTIASPSGKKYPPPAGRCWAIAEESFRKLLSDNRVWFGKNGAARPRLKRFLSEMEGQNAWSWWPNTEVGHNQEAKKEVVALFGADSPFDTPKPERLLSRIVQIATTPEDWILDSFAGSGTTGAVAHKMGRRWIMCELGEHCHTHIIPRMRKVIDGTDQGGVSQAADWKGGGGFKYYRLAETLLVRDPELSSGRHPIYVINPRYDERLLIRSICKIEGFRCRHEGRLHGVSSESRFLHVTTNLLTQAYLDSLASDLGETQSLLVYCTRKNRKLIVPDNIEIKKIPRDLLAKCDFEEDK